ncbi:MAG: hypothetical protein U7127_23600 [Phormidium sp.]
MAIKDHRLLDFFALGKSRSRSRLCDRPAHYAIATHESSPHHNGGS